MSGYDFHPEARTDLDAIHDYISQDSPDAADRVIVDILAAVRGLVPFPYQGRRRPDLTSRPLRFWRARDYLNCLCARGDAALGDCGDTWQPQPARYGGRPAQQGMNEGVFAVYAIRHAAQPPARLAFQGDWRRFLKPFSKRRPHLAFSSASSRTSEADAEH